MKLYLVTCAAALVLLAVGVGVATQGDSTPTPTHVVNVFLDGFNHGDFRQMCSTVRHADATCIKGYTMAAAQGLIFGVWGGYGVIPHSYKGWTEGSVKVASVKFRYLPNKLSQAITVRLIKTKHGWKIAGIR